MTKYQNVLTVDIERKEARRMAPVEMWEQNFPERWVGFRYEERRGEKMFLEVRTANAVLNVSSL